jgi:hypothetical protein
MGPFPAILSQSGTADDLVKSLRSVTHHLVSMLAEETLTVVTPSIDMIQETARYGS